MREDRLIEIFHGSLAETHNPAETAADLIRRVAGVYAQEINPLGNIPFAFVDEVFADVEAELLEIYRKKTYGHFSLESYRATLRRPAND